MARINVDGEELATIKRALARCAVDGHDGRLWSVLAIDPGKRSTGWALITDDGELHSGQGPPDEVADQLDAMLGLVGAPFLYAAEQPYTVTARQLAAGKGGIGAVAALQRALGYLEGALRRHLRRATLWHPKPTTWRAVLGLNRRSTDDATARDETAAAVLLWVRAETKLRLESARGKDHVDEAMAIGIAYAALALLRTVYASMQPARKTGRQPDVTPKRRLREAQMPLPTTAVDDDNDR